MVGLSGVGKTRLVQALFDAGIGNVALDPARVVYCDLADSPDPQPVAMLTSLVEAGEPAILVVDNCGDELHRRLVAVIRRPGCRVSLLTVEYDIREDRPEATDVVEMRPGSEELTTELIRRRFPHVSAVDARTVSGAAGGNARLAIALADTIRAGETVAGLRDDLLFRRLFHQRHQEDPELSSAAKACALVYSFDVTDLSDGGELAVLGQLAGRDALALYQRVAELRKRDLVQARGGWRAVLPHGIANWLARVALRELPTSHVLECLGAKAPARLRISFARRLGYLHDSEEACAILASWYATGGILGDPTALDEMGWEIFLNAAPSAPEAALAAIERGLAGGPGEWLVANHTQLVALVLKIAYDAILFERCVEVLIAIRLRKDPQKEDKSGEALVSLFGLYLSGTHASLEQRLSVLERLLDGYGPLRDELGIAVLEMMLEAQHFSSGHDFSFGLRSRDYGAEPDFQEAQRWFRAVLQIAARHAVSPSAIAGSVRRVLGRAVRGLWIQARMYDELEELSRLLGACGHWREGWVGVRRTLRFDRDRMPAAAYVRLEALERALRPQSLVDRVRAQVLVQESESIEHDGNDDEGEEGSCLGRLERRIEELGIEVAGDTSAFRELLVDLAFNNTRLFAFGRGLARGAARPRELWDEVAAAFAALPKEERGLQTLAGMLRHLGEAAPETAAALLVNRRGKLTPWWSGPLGPDTIRRRL